jgi:uncharacterized protein YodC (DUF2158 family)
MSKTRMVARIKDGRLCERIDASRKLCSCLRKDGVNTLLRGGRCSAMKLREGGSVIAVSVSNDGHVLCRRFDGHRSACPGWTRKSSLRSRCRWRGLDDFLSLHRSVYGNGSARRSWQRCRRSCGCEQCWHVAGLGSTVDQDHEIVWRELRSWRGIVERAVLMMMPPIQATISCGYEHAIQTSAFGGGSHRTFTI